MTRGVGDAVGVWVGLGVLVTVAVGVSAVRRPVAMGVLVAAGGSVSVFTGASGAGAANNCSRHALVVMNTIRDRIIIFLII
jgi:hypothetical protein